MPRCKAARRPVDVLTLAVSMNESDPDCFDILIQVPVMAVRYAVMTVSLTLSIAQSRTSEKMGLFTKVMGLREHRFLIDGAGVSPKWGNAKFLELASFSPPSIPEVSETGLNRMA